MSTAPADLYARDWYLWTLDQAAALRRLAESRWKGPLDLEHLAEEVDDLGRTARNAVVSQSKDEDWFPGLPRGAEA